jgi:hypothetical protein
VQRKRKKKRTTLLLMANGTGTFFGRQVRGDEMPQGAEK